MADASCAFLQSKGIERWLLFRMPRKRPPAGLLPEKIVLAMGSIYGTRDAPRSWYQHLKQQLQKKNFKECVKKMTEKDMKKKDMKFILKKLKVLAAVGIEIK